MGQSGPVWARVAAALAIAIALMSCTSANGATQPADPTAGLPTPRPTPTPTPEASEPAADEQVAALWESVHTARLEQVYAQTDPDPSAFDELATRETADFLVKLVGAARGDLPTVMTAVEFWPDIKIADDGREATVADCIIVSTQSADDPDDGTTSRTQVWTGTVALRDDGWRLDSIQLGQDSCVATSLSGQLLDAYRQYHEAWTAAWDPPDPDHPELAATMTGQRLTEIRDLLAKDRDAGVAFRDPHDPMANAVVFDVGVGRATVSDCHEPDPGYGAFDLETGERLDDETPPIQPGERHLTSVDLVRADDGKWKVDSAALLTDANCEPRGTAYVVAP